MQLFIKSLLGKTIVIDILKESCINDLKDIIENKEGIPKNIQKLTHCGKYLNENLKLYEYNINNYDSININLCLKGGGIPSYLRHVINEYPDTHFWDSEMNVDNFFIDFNSIIYSVIIKLNKNNLNVTPVVYENNLINAIIKQLQHIICNIVKPKKLLYIAVDGPPPRAKMIQQRSRRYKTIKEDNFIKLLEDKYNVKIPVTPWNKNAISPGTSFMYKLSKTIIDHIRKRTFHIHNDNLTIIFSDDSIPGEGEHKILPNIKKIKNNELNVIYSPDADLIVLSILSDIPNIYIIREPPKYEELKIYDKHEYIYINIDVCKREFNNELTDNLEISFNDNYKKIIYDYSFLTFLCGNDFVIAAPFLKMKEGGINLLIEIYKNVWELINPNNTRTINNCQFLIYHDSNGNIKINYMFLLTLLKEISYIEEDKLKKWQKKRDKIRKRTVDNSKNTWEIELLNFQHEEYYSPLNPYYERFNRVFDKINYFEDSWSEQYNNYYFQDININDVCYEYYKSLEFCLKYYFEGYPPSWLWYYKYRAAPTIKDFVKYIENNYDDINNIKFEKDSPCKPFEQLMLILPKQSFKLLPKIININDKLDKYYPKNFVLDIVQGTKFIYSEPILPDILIDDIKEYINSIQDKFTNFEKDRNILRSKPFVYKTKKT